MFRLVSAATVLGLIAGPAWGQSGKAYTIKFKKTDQCEKLLVEATDQAVVTTKKVENSSGRLLDEEKQRKIGRLITFLQTVLEKKPGQKATRLTRKYEKATYTLDDETRELPYDGKTVRIGWTGDRYVFRIEGGERLLGQDALDLEEEFNKKGQLEEVDSVELLIPSKAVKVGEEWKINTEAIAMSYLREAAPIELVPGTTKATGKLLRVYKKGGRLFGVITLSVQISPKLQTTNGTKLVLQPGSRATYKVTIDGCIDGSFVVGTTTVEVDCHIETLLPSDPIVKLIITTHCKRTMKYAEQ